MGLDDGNSRLATPSRWESSLSIDDGGDGGDGDGRREGTAAPQSANGGACKASDGRVQLVGCVGFGLVCVGPPAAALGEGTRPET
jgi:hypothetical protein